MVFLLYLTDVLSQLQPTLSIIAVCLLIGAACYAGISSDMGETVNIKIVKRMLVTGCVFILIAVLIPSKKTMYLMVAASVVKDVMADPKVKALNDRVFDIINTKLDELEGKKK